MSCRTTPHGSLATSYARTLFGLTDSQSSSLFHQLVREHNARENQIVTEDEYNRGLSRILAYVFDHREIWPEGSARKDRIIAKVNVLANQETPPDPALAYALINMDRAARSASEAIKSYILFTSRATSFSEDEVEDEYKRLMTAYALDQHPTLGARIITEEQTPPLDPPFPSNKATLYAINKLKRWIKCPDCGFGRYLGVRTSHENCSTEDRLAGQAGLRILRSTMLAPFDASQEELNNQNQNDMRILHYGSELPIRFSLDNLFGDSMEEENQSPDLSKPMPVIPPPLAWDMQEFQEAYDKAKATIQANNYFLTPNLELESIPGAITGGLGSRDTGNSFGIEIEVDFPDDVYPFNARRELAKRLHKEGIARYPEVAGWHHVGPGREGGNFTIGPSDWICEFDRTVDNVDGERGVEIKSQIMFDEPETWRNLRRVCEIITELGGKPTPRTGLHINIGGSKFPNDDPRVHTSLLKIAGAYDDTIVRLAHNPLSAPTHRGRRYCQPVVVPPEGFGSVHQAKVYANHYQSFNLNHLPEEGDRHYRSSRVEVRVFDSTLDPVRIQTSINLSLALVEASIKGVQPGSDIELAGSHRSANPNGRLSGEAWEKSTESFRRLVSFTSALGLESQWHKDCLTTLFASSKWQSGNNFYNSDEDQDQDYDDDYED